MKILLLLFCLQEDPPPPAIDAGYDGGFYIAGEDLRLTFEGLLQTNARLFEPNGAHESEFVLR